MTWEQQLLELFDDLEQQAAGLELAHREVDVAELSAAAYAEVTLSARLHASVGSDVRIRVLGGQLLTGRLLRVGADWVLVKGSPEEWVVPLRSIESIVGLSEHADAIAAGGMLARLSLGSVLRRLASAGEECILYWIDQQQLVGRLGRVGRDFVEVQAGEDRRVHVVPLDQIGSLRGCAS